MVITENVDGTLSEIKPQKRNAFLGMNLRKKSIKERVGRGWENSASTSHKIIRLCNLPNHIS